MPRMIIAVALLAALAGCASAGRDTVPCTILQQSAACAAVRLHPDNAASALEEAPAGFAYLYIVRPYAQQRSEKTVLYVDDAQAAELGSMSFVRLKVQPGMHVVRMRTSPVGETVMKVEVAQSTFLEYRLAQHFFSLFPDIREVSREHAGRFLPRLKRAVSTAD